MLMVQVMTQEIWRASIDRSRWSGGVIMILEHGVTSNLSGSGVGVLV